MRATRATRALLALLALADAQQPSPSTLLGNAMTYETGWASALQDALKQKRVDANAKVVTAAKMEVTPLFVALKAVADGEAGGLELVNELLARKEVDVNVPCQADGVVATPVMLAVIAGISGSDDGYSVARALLARADVVLTPPPSAHGTASLLGYALSAYATGQLRGLAVARLLLARDDVDVNEITEHDGSRVSPLGVLVGAIATNGGSGGLAMARALCMRSDVDVHAVETLPDGSTTTPLLRARRAREEWPELASLAEVAKLLELRAEAGRGGEKDEP